MLSWPGRCSDETDFTSRGAHAEAPVPRVNGGLNSTVMPESTFGRDTRDSLYASAGSAFSLEGTGA